VGLRADVSVALYGIPQSADVNKFVATVEAALYGRLLVWVTGLYKANAIAQKGNSAGIATKKSDREEYFGVGGCPDVGKYPLWNVYINKTDSYGGWTQVSRIDLGTVTSCDDYTTYLYKDVPAQTMQQG